MAFLKRDNKFNEARMAVRSLGNSDNDKLIKYYIEHQSDRILKQIEQIKEYKDFFKLLKKLQK